jgi:hypothetical protein
MSDASEAPRTAWPATLAAVAVLVQLTVDAGYGIFRDELYYIACAKRLAWGYVDQPPLSIAFLWLERLVLPDTALSLRLIPALLGGAVVYLAGRLAARMGGGSLAQAAASLGVFVAPIFLGTFHYYSMNSFDMLAWTLVLLLFARYQVTRDERLWIVIGVVLGLGLLNKISVLWLGFGLAVALLASAERRVLLTRSPWLAAGIAGLLFAPHLVWQLQNGWPTLEFMHNATEGKMAAVSLADFIRHQIENLDPLALPLWLGGLLWLLLAPEARRFRPLAFVYLSVFVLLAAGGKSRAGYLGPACPVLFAAGGVALSRIVGRRQWLGWAYLAVVAASGVALAPLAIPALPVESYVRYARTLGIEPGTEEKKDVGPLPQHFADRFGWPELAEATARVYRALPEADRAQARIFTTNYGRAGALELYGEALGLPPVICGHNNYWLWGPGSGEPRVFILVGDSIEDYRAAFDQVEERGSRACPYCMPYESHIPILVARGPRRPLKELWARVKNFS